MKFNPKLFINFLLALIAALYYFPFINKGLIIFDEGYIVHFAERITQGQIPYYDFFIQYTPGFFYILALSFKIFGTSIIVERFITVIIAIAVLLVTLFIVDELKLSSIKFKLACVVILISFGFPLFNIPIVVWPCILLTSAIMLYLFRWSKSPFAYHKFAIYLGILLAIMLFMKQNIGFIYLVLLNLFIIFSEIKKITLKIKFLAVMNSAFLILSLPWIYFFFLRNNYLFTFLNFNQIFFKIYPFSYPPLSYLLEPLGIFKLLPYYLPIVFLLLLIYSYIFKKYKKTYIYISLLPIAGFAVTVVPASDLLHVYPFLGLTLVMFLIFLANIKMKYSFRIILLFLIIFTVISGFYLALFREQYRYGLPYKQSTVLLNLPKTKNILVDINVAKEYPLLNDYIAENTKIDDYIFVYPFSPMLYFIFDRQNPSRYANYSPGYLTENEEKQAIEEIKNKKVSLIIVSGNYKFKTLLSQWIQENTVLAKASTVGINILMVKNE